MGQIKMAKGWRRWVMIVFLIALLALAVLAFTGCSSTSSGSAGNTPLGQLQANVSALSSRIGQVEAKMGTYGGDGTIGNTVWTQGNTITSLQTTITGYGEKIANLEARNCSCNGTAITTCDLSAINASLTMQGLRITAIENHLAATPTPTPTATPTGNVTPTPTTIPSGNHAPTILTLVPARIGSTNDSWIVTCAANDSDGDAISYLWATTGGNVATLYGNSSVLWWGISVNGSYSIACQASDGRGGYDIEIVSVNYP